MKKLFWQSFTFLAYFVASVKHFHFGSGGDQVSPSSHAMPQIIWLIPVRVKKFQDNFYAFTSHSEMVKNVCISSRSHNCVSNCKILKNYENKCNAKVGKIALLSISKVRQCGCDLWPLKTGMCEMGGNRYIVKQGKLHKG